MPKIDAYLKNIAKLKANGMRLRSNESIVLRFDAGDRAAVQKVAHDDLVEMVQEIADHFLFGQQAAGATLIAPTVRVLYLQEHLQKLRQFTSVITLTFRGWRQAA